MTGLLISGNHLFNGDWYKNIIRDYEHMQRAKYTRNSIIDNLVGKYGLTKQTIKKRIRKYEEEKGININN